MGRRTRRVARAPAQWLAQRAGWSGAWRTYVEARTVEIAADARRAVADHNLGLTKTGRVQFAADQPAEAGIAAGYDAIRRHITLARYYTFSGRTLRDWLTGRAVDGAWVNLHTASARLLLMQTPEQVCGRVPEVFSAVRAYLPQQDPRRVAVERRFGSTQDLDPSKLSRVDRETLATALYGAYFMNAVEYSRVRRFRNVVLGAFISLTLVVAAVVVVGTLWPQVVPLCFPADTGPHVCPTGPHLEARGGDLPMVALLGLVGAVLAASRALTTGQELPTRYSPAIVLALLKAPTGVVTAILGLVAFSSGLVPGLSEVRSQNAILFWSVVFGYGQQLLTGLLDQRAQNLLKAASPTTPAAQSLESR